ncbi:MAG: type II toxin-antitoxin system HipA family toxin [Luteolibacter sp.]|uniref:type II toxin-antitoxin system HipA family toxin n=1 Tax=Luteolibacter sp. TaxID=1962973 RepID=UPI003262D996
MELEVHWAGEGEQRIGRLYQDPRGAVFFEYDAAWRVGSRELSPFYLPNGTTGAVTTSTPAFGELHGLFQDTLPDWWGERLMRQHFEDRGIPWKNVTVLRKLACQGDRKMGALAFRPDLDGKDFNDGMIAELGALVEAAREALRGESGHVLAELLQSGMSPGGAQPKALLALSDDFSEIRLDDPAPEGFGSWLIKFDTEPVLHEGGIEAAYAAMARAAGIDMPETRLLEAAGGRHFLTRRFDRTADGKRLHLHSYSGLTHTPLRDGLEYGDLMELARVLTGDHRAVEEIFRRAVFNVAASNDDDHGRNHAFLMDGAGNWKLAPAFDVTLATYPLASGFRAARVMGKAGNITRRDLKRLGEEQGVRKVDDAIDHVLNALADWERLADDHGLPRATASRVGQQHGLTD